jgi:predicted outer membrane repeat protein
MKILIIPCLLYLLLLPECTAQARTWYVEADGTGDAPTVQAGIDSARVGDSVILGCGTYYEHDITMKSGIYLGSSTGLANCVTIDAQGLGRVISCVNATNPTSITGLTLTGGEAPFDSTHGGMGGGMYVSESSVTITNCSFLANHADQGFGGGAFCWLRSTSTFINCAFQANSAIWGGGLSNEALSTILISCVFSGNSSYYGGGLYSRYLVSLSVTGCLFLRNTAKYYGGGLDTDSQSSINNCTFSGNSAYCAGGVCWRGDWESGQLSLTNTIIAFSPKGAAIRCIGNDNLPTVTCCDFYANNGGDWVYCIADQSNVTGNFSLDPQFCDIGSDNYTVKQCSPCAPGNQPNGWSCGLIGALPVGCSGTAITPTTWGKIKALFR